MEQLERTKLGEIAAGLKAKAEEAARIGDSRYAEAAALEEGGAAPSELAVRWSEQKAADDLAEALSAYSEAIDVLVGQVPV